MSIFPYILIFTVSSLVVTILTIVMTRHARQAERGLPDGDFTVRQSKAYLVLGIICTVMFGGSIAAITVLVEAKSLIWWLYPFFGGFTFLGVYAMLYALRWRVDVGNETFTYQPALGSAKIIPYTSITRTQIVGPSSLHEGPRLMVFTGKKRATLAVENTCINYAPFLAQIKSKELCSYDRLR